MFILPIEIVIVIERQVLLNQYQNLLFQHLHNSTCVGWENSSTWCVDSLLHKKYYANVSADSLPMHFVGYNPKFKISIKNSLGQR